MRMRRRRRRRRRRRWLLRMALKLTPKRATTTLKTTTVRKQRIEQCENTKVYRALITKCPNCFWHDYYKICPRNMRSPDPRGEKLHQRGLSSVSRLWSNLHRKKRRRWKPIFIPPLKRRTKKRINFSFLSNRCVFDSFCHWFSIKFLKRYLVSGFIVSVY